MAEHATTTAQPGASAATLWRCGGRQCGAGECEHEENELHRQASGPGPALAPPVVHDVLRSAGSPLPDALRTEMEHRFAHDFSDVRIHTGTTAGRSAQAVAASAYTVGRRVVFAPGQYDPVSPAGRQLIAHELSHAADAGPGTGVPAGDLRISSPQDAAEQRARRVAASPDAGPAGAQPAPGPTLHRQDTTPAAPPAATTPVTCSPARALTWADFTGSPPAQGPHAAKTRWAFTSTTSGGRAWIVATFQGSTSWVKTRWRNAGTRADNGCAPDITACQQFFDSLGPGETGEQSLGPTTGCAASPQLNTSLRATNRGECETVLGTECDRVAVADSVRLLHHEQLHFDLACAMARKGNAALAATPAPNTQTILTAVDTKTNQQTTAYDTASNHGCNATGQSTWDTAVAQGLPSVTIP